jgi:phenylalanyl-tRNA synthetase beta chain
MADELPAQRTNLALEYEHFVRDVLTAAGLNEAITYSLTSIESASKLDASQHDATTYLRLANPLSAEREYMRRAVLPTLLEAAMVNVREQGKTRLFEIGHVYLPVSGQLLPNEPLRVAIVMAGPRHNPSWQAANPESIDFFDIKGIVETLCERLMVANAHVTISQAPYLQPGRAATLMLADREIGHFGELHPDVRANFGLPNQRTVVAELDLASLIAAAQVPTYRSISRYPASTQDLALIAPVHVPAERIEAAIRKYAGPALYRVELFDVYSGAQLEPGYRSLAYRVSFRSTDRTLADDEVTKLRNKIIRGVEFDTGAKIRS